MSDHPEILAALDALDGVLALRLEERKGPLLEQIRTGRQTQQRTNAIPPRHTYLQGGPLAEMCDILPIDDVELLQFIGALAPHIDERYQVLITALSARSETAVVTGEMLRNLCPPDPTMQQVATRALGPDGLLRRVPLLELEASPNGPLAGAIVVPPSVLSGLIDAPPIAPELSPEFPASPLTTVHGVDDLVVSRDARRRIDDVLARIVSRPEVLQGWGLGAHHDSVAGVTVLLHGPPGTGKSMTAAVLAAEAGMRALRVDLSTLVSKYIGETAKNLEAVFRYAEQSPCLLFFDEADSVFGKRGEVSDARDRYANQEVSYLLQRIESFPGVVVLATNFLANIDTAFLRRINILIELNPPDKRQRRKLWQHVYPDTVPVESVSFADLANRYQLTGAQIKEAAMEAAYQASSNGGKVTTEHLEKAVRFQFAKSGLMAPE